MVRSKGFQTQAQHPNRSIRIVVVSLVALLSGLLLSSCAKERTVTPTDTTTYYTDIKFILDSKCATSSCHSGATQADGLDLSSYAGVLAGSTRGQVVVLGRADISRLFQTMDGTSLPLMPIDEKLDQALITSIGQWINDGLFESR